METGAVMELATALAPQHFLLLACTANLSKNLAAVAASATRAPIYRTFAKQNNLADITAKGACRPRPLARLALLPLAPLAPLGAPWRAWHCSRWHRLLPLAPLGALGTAPPLRCAFLRVGESVANLADVLGTGFGILLTRAATPLVPTFGILSLGYLLASRREVDSVVLPYLNRARLSYVARAFWNTGPCWSAQAHCAACGSVL
jgi:hypothetical protein